MISFWFFSQLIDQLFGLENIKKWITISESLVLFCPKPKEIKFNIMQEKKMQQVLILRVFAFFLKKWIKWLSK